MTLAPLQTDVVDDNRKRKADEVVQIADLRVTVFQGLRHQVIENGPEWSVELHTWDPRRDKWTEVLHFPGGHTQYRYYENGQVVKYEDKV